jgi:hypothetical protein
MSVRVSGSSVVITLRRPRANALPKVTGALTLTAAAIHLVLTPEHFDQQVAYGWFFLAAAAFQGALGWLLFARPGPRVYRAGAFGSLLLIVTWIVTRTAVPPLAAHDSAEPVTALGVLATGAELATLMLLAAALPVPTARARWLRWTWAAGAGVAFAALFMLTSGALSYVPFTRGSPSLEVLNTGFSLNSPLIYGMLAPHVWLVGSWSVLAFTGVAAALVAANVASLSAHRALAPECNARPSSIVALGPSLLAVSSCCGAPLALFLGTTAVGFLFQATPYLLLITIVLLVANLLLTRRAAADSHPHDLS